jgi:hypothetical protein
LRWGGALLVFARNRSTGHATCHAQPDAEHSPDGLRFHLVATARTTSRVPAFRRAPDMMVAADLGLFLRIQQGMPVAG